MVVGVRGNESETLTQLKKVVVNRVQENDSGNRDEGNVTIGEIVGPEGETSAVEILDFTETDDYWRSTARE